MALPYLVFASCIGELRLEFRKIIISESMTATSLLSLVQSSMPTSMSVAAGHRNWTLISWSISTALYYLLSILIVVRIVYHRHIIRKQIGDQVEQFASYLTIFNESGAILLIFATAYLISLVRYPNLVFLFQSLVAQIQASRHHLQKKDALIM